MKGKTLRVVALQLCDDIKVYGGSKMDLQHNVGIVAEWCRVTQMKMNGPKSSYMTTEATEGITPDWSPTLKRTWLGGRDGESIPDTGLGNRLAPKAADSAVRNLGVWRAASGTIDTQQAVLEKAVDKIAAPLRQYGYHLSAIHIAYVLNAVLNPRLEYPLNGSSAWGTRAGKAMVQNLDQHVRKFSNNVEQFLTKRVVRQYTHQAVREATDS